MYEYMLFAGSIYYPSGGWEDFKGYFDDIEKAKNWLRLEEKDASFMWAHIVYKNNIIWKGLDQGDTYLNIPKDWTWEETNV